MGLTFKKAVISDVELLMETRLEVLKAANHLDAAADLSEVRRQSCDYYLHSLADGSHAAYLVFDGERFAGVGGISFYQVMPTYHNPSGYKAYVMNMYTRPEYRRRGVALRVLDLLVTSARERGITHITLEATEHGRPLYERYGFIKMEHEMELPVNGQPLPQGFPATDFTTIHPMDSVL